MLMRVVGEALMIACAASESVVPVVQTSSSRRMCLQDILWSEINSNTPLRLLRRFS